MSPLIKTRPGFGRKLVAPQFDFEQRHDLPPPHRAGATAASRRCGAGSWRVGEREPNYNPPVRTSRTIKSRMMAPIVE